MVHIYPCILPLWMIHKYTKLLFHIWNNRQYTNWYIPMAIHIYIYKLAYSNIFVFNHCGICGMTIYKFAISQLIFQSESSQSRTGETRPPGWSSERCSSFPTSWPSPPALWSPCFCGMLGDGSPEGEMCSQESMKSGGRYIYIHIYKWRFNTHRIHVLYGIYANIKGVD